MIAPIRPTSLLPVLALVAGPLGAAADPAGIEGFFEITSRLELPHLERWAIDKTVVVCLPAGAVPVPVLSVNTPFSHCAAQNIRADENTIEYEIACPGRAAARAHARYVHGPDGFSGRVAMVMAAKNMTMTEVVRARRLGVCPASLAAGQTP